MAMPDQRWQSFVEAAQGVTSGCMELHSPIWFLLISEVQAWVLVFGGLLCMGLDVQ
jgi:hypothetical protein